MMAMTGATGAVVAIEGVRIWDTAHPRRRRYVEQAYAKMSTKEKETLKYRMAEIDEAGPVTRNPHHLASSPCR